MKKFVYLLPLCIFLIIVGYFAVGLTLNPRDIPSMLINHKAPYFNLKPIKGSMRGFSQKDLEGQVSIINIFGSWCSACISEHSFLMEINNEKLVPIYGIDWRERNANDGPQWLAQRGNPYTLVGNDPESEAAIALGVTGAPETFVVDKKGFIRYKHIGPINSNNWKNRLWPIIQKLRKQ